MGRFTKTCVLFLFASELYQVLASKPRIITPSEEDDVLYVREGDELKIECEGRGKLKFWPEKIDRHNPAESETYVDEDTRRTVFVRKETTAADTGWYACAEEGIPVSNEESTIDHQQDNIAWIYVYVKDSSEVFAIRRDIILFVPVTTGGSAVIPCRTTMPRKDVTLFLNGDPNKVSPGWTYDPRIGFRKEKVAKFEDGDYDCGIDGVFDGYGQVFKLLVVDFNKELPMPVIDKKPLKYVVWGKNLTLKCSVEVPTGLHLSLIWTAPRSVPQTRQVVSEYIDYTTSRQMTNLTVVNATRNDNGRYLCSVQDLSAGRRENDFQDIVFHDPNIPSINVTGDDEKFSIEVNEGTPVQWKLVITAYPDDLKWEWFNPSGYRILDSKVGTTSLYNHRQEESTHFFGIPNVDANHNGHYKLKLSTGNFSETVTLILTVKGRPKVKVTRDTPEYGVGQRANFTCTARGSPLPKITWDFVEYPDSASSGNQEKRDFSLLLEKDDNISEATSRVEIETNAAGRLTCTACSNKNCTNGTFPTSTTDPNEHFGLSGPYSAATAGDNVTLTCHVSLENYKDELRWQFSGSSALPIAEGRKDTANEKYVSKLTLLDVGMSAHGTYTCVAETKTNETDNKTYDLKIEEPSPPDILETLFMNDSAISVTPKQPITLACYAKGAPKPKISWYMNGEQLEGSSQYSFMDGNSSLRIEHFYLTDGGRYSCLAENRLGRVERSMKIQVEGGSQSASVTSIIIICTLIVIIVMVITFMGYKVRREKQLRKALTDAGLNHFVEGAVESLNPDLPVDDQAELLPYDNKWEFPRENLKLGKQLGSGAFGVVMKAEAKGICVEGEVTTVAVKMVRRTAEPSYMKALASELKIMIHLGRHINVVNLLGACTKTILTKRELLVIVEYCHFGNLHHYLQHHRNNFIDQIDPSTQKIDPDIGLELLNTRTSVAGQNKSIYDRVLSYTASPSIKSSHSNNSVELVNYRPDLGYQGEVNMFPDGGVLSNNSVQPGWRSNYRGDYKDQNLKPICTQDLLCWAWQVSRGMEYLSSRNVLHGDLAARNILLAEDNIVKICDFGLAKNMYKDNNYKKKGDTPLPIKWMAVESIRDRIFSTHSDVWSFGIVLWEFFTLARTPYPGMEAERQYDRLMEGHRLEKPEYATEEIYNFMLDCWKAEPTSRPSFPDLANKFGALLNERVKTRYFDLNTPYANMNAIALQNRENDYLTMMSSPNHVYCNTPNSEIDPATGYVPMSRVLKSPDAGPSVLSPKFTETHFDFVLDNAKPELGPENCITESRSMLEDVVSVINQQGTKPSGDNNSESKDEGYCRIAGSPSYSNFNNGHNSGNKSQIKDRDDHVIDMFHQDEKSPKIDNPTTESFTNPSYVVMAKNPAK